jgi:hypothetical protein
MPVRNPRVCLWLTKAALAENISAPEEDWLPQNKQQLFSKRQRQFISTLASMALIETQHYAAREGPQRGG